jgi:hypothetical protein
MFILYSTNQMPHMALSRAKTLNAIHAHIVEKTVL